jgi:hypothetical protein
MARDFGVQLFPPDGPPNHEGSRCADVDHVEVLQLLREHGGPEPSVTADVETPHEHHERRTIVGATFAAIAGRTFAAIAGRTFAAIVGRTFAAIVGRTFRSASIQHALSL